MALASVIGEPDPEIRATAIAGLARRKQAVEAHDAIEHGLDDPDWRVAVEAVRALAGDSGDDAGRVLVASQLPAMLERATARDGADTQVLVEALRVAVRAPAERGRLDRHVRGIARRGSSARRAARRSRRVRAAGSTCSPARSPRSWRRAPRSSSSSIRRIYPSRCSSASPPSSALHQDLEARRALLRVMLSIRDPRVKAATLPVLVSMWKDSDADEHRAIAGMFVSALATPDVGDRRYGGREPRRAVRRDRRCAGSCGARRRDRDARADRARPRARRGAGRGDRQARDRRRVSRRAAPGSPVIRCSRGPAPAA